MGRSIASLIIISVFMLLSACTQDSDVLYSQAQTEAELGSRQRAMDYLVQIQANDPQYTDAYTFAAQLFIEDQNYPEAIAQLKRGLDAKADSAVITNMIGEIYHQREDLDQAYYYYSMALKLNAENEAAQVNMGTVLADKALFDQAVVHFNQALALNPGNYDAYIGKALALAAVEETGEAIDLLEKAIELESMRGEAYGALAFTQEKTGTPREAIIENYALAVRLTPQDQSTWLHYLDFVSADTNRQDVIKVHQRYNASFPNDLEGYHRLAKLYLDLALEEGLSWLDAAKNQCDNALLIDGDDHVSHANLARIYLLQEKPRLAVLEAQLAFEIQPSSDYRELVDRAKYKLK